LDNLRIAVEVAGGTLCDTGDLGIYFDGGADAIT
jgi:hypothetical protein